MRIGSSETRRNRPPFIGRGEESEYLRAELGRGAGLITLAGPSGLGKTRLAQQVAGALIEAFDEEGGVWFCNLSGCRSAKDLEAEVARTLEISQREGDELARSIENRGPLLLILDNADPIAERMGPVIEGWLERCVELQMIVTSIAPVGVQGEVVLELRPLEPEDAVALYLDRAQRAWADRSFSSEETEQIRDLVRRLDCLPLAIELAAARVRLLPPRSMPSWLERRFELLHSSPRSEAPDHSPRRAASLLGAIELTWSHLDPHEQLVLARASVFEGGFTSAAAEAILAADAPKLETSDEQAERWVLETLTDLRRKSLLVFEDAEAPRYYLLESVKEYALRALKQMDRWEETIRRHATCYLRQDEAQGPRMSERRQMESIPWLKEERANLVAILQRFLASDPHLAANAGIALTPLIAREGQHASQLIETTLGAARRSSDPTLILAALEALSIVEFWNGRDESARISLEEAVELARRSGDPAAEALALARLSIVYIEQGLLPSGSELLQRATALSLDCGLPAVEGYVCFARGIDAIRSGRLEDAEAHLARATRLLRESEAINSAANALYTLGVALSGQRRYDEARRLIHDAIELCRSHPFESHFLSNLANIELCAGRVDESEATYEQCLLIQRRLGNRFQEGMSLGNLALISLERGELDAAASRLIQAEELFLDCGARDSRAQFLVFSAILEAIQGQPVEARQILSEALAYVSPGGQGVSHLLVEGAEAFLEIAAARQLQATDREGAAKRIESARSRLAAIHQEDAPWPTSAVPVLRRLLERELGGWDTGIPPQPRNPWTPVLSVGAGREWFQLPGTQRIVLRNRQVLHRIFKALVEARLRSPGIASRTDELIEAGWPQGEMSQESAAARLKAAIWILRDLGLRTVVKTDPSGYLLDPAVALEERDEP